MSDSHTCTCPHFGDGKPVSPEIWQEVVNVLHASSWITILHSAQFWGALRRIPPKAFLLEQVDKWLAHATNPRQYVHFSEDEMLPALERRSAPMKRLRDLLVAWEPPVVTDEIREAARVVHISEFGRPPDENWAAPEENEPPMPLEATLLWPEGEWNEEAFLAGKMNIEGNEHP